MDEAGEAAGGGGAAAEAAGAPAVAEAVGGEGEAVLLADYLAEWERAEVAREDASRLRRGLAAGLGLSVAIYAGLFVLGLLVGRLVLR